jgi:transcriptional regulator with XRE-family HTH domain
MRFPATRLAEIRQQRGITQNQLAALLGLSPSSVSAVENGHVRPWPRFRREAARCLGIDESALFPEHEVPRERHSSTR